jgi:hypothetical protein
MTIIELENIKQRMQQLWYELVAAEQQGAAQSVLERLGRLYFQALEEYNRCTALYQSEQIRQALPMPLLQKSERTTMPNGSPRKKAS